jgi:hypothetical protein
MPKIPGVSHAQAIRVLRKVGFEVVRESKHMVMSDGGRILTYLGITRLMHSQWEASPKMLDSLRTSFINCSECNAEPTAAGNAGFMPCLQADIVGPACQSRAVR